MRPDCWTLRPSKCDQTSLQAGEPLKYLMTMYFSLSDSSTYLHHFCHRDKGTSIRFLDRWRIQRKIAGNQTFPSSFLYQAALLDSFCLQGFPQSPVPRKRLLVWLLSGSWSPLCSGQSFPWWDEHGPFRGHSACNGDKLKSVFLWLTLTLGFDWTDSGCWVNRKPASGRRKQPICVATKEFGWNGKKFVF